MKIKIEKIGLYSSFFSIGGDSLSSIRLVNACRKDGFKLLVQDVFESQTLESMAKKLSKCQDAYAVNYNTYASHLHNLSKEEFESSIKTTLNMEGIEINMIEDIYPASPLQNELISLTQQDPAQYLAQFIYEVSGIDNISVFEVAWNNVVARIPILRTTFIYTTSRGCLQVVLKQQN